MSIENPNLSPASKEDVGEDSQINPNFSLHSILDQIKEADEETLRKINTHIGDKTLFPTIRGEKLETHTIAKKEAVQKRAEELGIDLFPDTVRPK